MKVTRLGGTKETSSTKRKSKDAVDSGAFADNLVETQFSPSVAAAPDATTVSAADAVLAAQNVGDSSHTRRNAAALRNLQMTYWIGWRNCVSGF